MLHSVSCRCRNQFSERGPARTGSLPGTGPLLRRECHHVSLVPEQRSGRQAARRRSPWHPGAVRLEGEDLGTL